MSFYIRDLSILRFWYPAGVLEPIPHRYKGRAVLSCPKAVPATSYLSEFNSPPCVEGERERETGRQTETVGEERPEVKGIDLSLHLTFFNTSVTNIDTVSPVQLG